MIEERITRGLSVKKTEATPVVEPVSLADVKLFMSIDNALTVHDNTITALITASRTLLEDKLGIALVEKEVIASWREFYDFEKLPYWPVKTDTDTVITDLSGVAIDSENYSLTGEGGFLTLSGNFPNGVKVSYTAKYAAIPPQYIQYIKSMVYEVFINKKSLDEALRMHVKSLP